MNPLESLVSSFLALGGRPDGDPQAMLAEGQKLRQLAGKLDTETGLLQRQSPIPYYEGPQADSYAAEIQHHVAAFNGLSQQMHHLADGLIKASGRLANEQTSWDRRFQRHVTGMPAAIVHQAERMVGWR